MKRRDHEASPPPNPPLSRGREPRLETVAIIGVGLIGGSLGMALRQRRVAGRVIGVARRRETLEMAQQRGAIDRGTHDAAQAVADADLVVLAAPVHAIIEHVGQLAARFRDGALVTDVGSTKVEIMRAAASLPAGIAFVGGHPMAGSEESGPGAARADLFEGAVWVLTPPPAGPKQVGAGRQSPPPYPPPRGGRGQSGGAALATMEALVAALGAQPLVLDAAEHDALVALTSHLPHLAAWALVNAVSAAGSGRAALARLIGPGFRDTTRIAQAEPAMWRDILLTNRARLLPAMAALRGELDRLERALADGDADALATILDQAAQARRELSG